MIPPKHVAIIMDGNGRWGLKYKKSRNAGHKQGLNTVEKIIKISLEQKIKYLTLYAFSTENWKRPKSEIKYLFNLLENFLINKLEELNKNKVFNTKNSSQPITFDMMLNSRRFNSTIYKEENVYEDREVKEYIYEDALRQLLESDRIKSVIRDFEQDQWNN